VSRTTAPSAAYASAIARPIPLLAPVTTARRPSSRPGRAGCADGPDVAGYASTPPANGWRAASDESRIVLRLGSLFRARAIASFVAV
jgi:hypothetical protein